MGIGERLRALASLTGHADSWYNPTTGLGTSRDKLTGFCFGDSLTLPDGILEGMYYNDDIAGRIVSSRPREMLRKGYELLLPDNPEGLKRLQAEAKRLCLDDKVLEMMLWGRLYRDALILVGVDDGRDPSEPVDTEALDTTGSPYRNVRAIRFLNVIDRRHLFVARVYSDPLEPNYGEPELYQIFSPLGPNGLSATQSTQPGAVIHESRTIRWSGELVDSYRRVRLAGWSQSVIQRPYDVMRQFAGAWVSTGHLLQDASQGVFKIKNLINMITGDNKTLQTRMQLVDMSRSVARAVLLDAGEEDFTRVATSFAGLPDMLDRFMQRLAAACDMPVTLLMGRSPAGQNATGDSDFRHWYDTISSEQENDLKPRLLKLYALLGAALGIDTTDLDIRFHPLWTLTEKERAEVGKLVADTDSVYITAQVWHPEEVALVRGKPGGALTEFTLTDDGIELRQAAVDALGQFEDPLMPRGLPPGLDPTKEDPNATGEGTNKNDPQATDEPAPKG